MKLKKCNIFQIIMYILIHTLIFLKNSNYAANNNQIIKIYSEHQSINQSTNVINFTKNVICEYKNIQLHANKITIIPNQKKHYLFQFTAYGHPVTINYIQTTGCTTSATAEVVHYSSIDNTVTLSGNSYIKYLENSIHSDNIIYYIKQKKIQAIANQNNQTTTILSINPT